MQPEWAQKKHHMRKIWSYEVLEKQEKMARGGAMWHQWKDDTWNCMKIIHIDYTNIGHMDFMDCTNADMDCADVDVDYTDVNMELYR
jgi:hypothetical protein